MKINRRFTCAGQDPYQGIVFEKRQSEIRNPDGKIIFGQEDVQVPSFWSQIATDILALDAPVTVGVIGCGAQAVTQIHAISRVRRIERVVAYDVDVAGNEGAAMWEMLSARAQRLMPLAGKDVTDFYVAGGNLRTWVQFALATDGESTTAQVETRAPISPAPWDGQLVRIEDLPDLQAEYGLRVVGGDPDLDGKPWQPKIYLVEDKA